MYSDQPGFGGDGLRSLGPPAWSYVAMPAASPSPYVSIDSGYAAWLSWSGGIGAPQATFGGAGLSYSVLPHGTITGAASVALGGLSASASGLSAAPIAGSADIPLGPLVVVASASATTGGVSVDSSDAAIIIWNGGVGAPETLFNGAGLAYSVIPPNNIIASASITLGGLTGSGVGLSASPSVGSAAIALGGVSAVASATRGSAAAVAITLGPLAASASGISGLGGFAAISLGSLIVAADGFQANSATADVGLGPLVVDAGVISGLGGFADITLGRATAVAAGFLSITATSVIALSPLIADASASAAAPIVASASVTLGPLVADAAAAGGGPPPAPALQSTVFTDFFASVLSILNSTGIFGPQSVAYVIDPDAADEYPVLAPPFALVEPGGFADNGWSEGGGRNTKVWEIDIKIHLVVQNVIDTGFFAGNVITSPSVVFGIYSLAQQIIDKFEQAYVTDGFGQLQIVELPVASSIGPLGRKTKSNNYVSTLITFRMLVSEKLPSNLP